MFFVRVILVTGIVSAVTYFSLTAPLVFAARCEGNCEGVVCGQTKDDWCEAQGCDFVLSNGEEYCDKGKNAICGCNNAKCVVWRGETCTNVEKYCNCDCEEVACPPGVPKNKFMTTGTTASYGTRCVGADACKGTRYPCEDSYKNTPPSCDMLPANITMDRNDAPRQIELTVTDQDYGDTVQVTGYRTVNGSQINSCLKLSTLGGGELLNLTVKAGSDDPANVSQVTALLADPRGLHGVFENVGGESVCSGKLEVEIRDIDSDGTGPDVSDTAKCSINITVKNEAPRLIDVTIKDNDGINGIEGIPEDGDLLDGRGKIFVGSVLTRKPEDEARASFCSKPLNTTLNPVICTPGDEHFGTFSRKHNPFILEFTVADSNGRADIMQAGFWIQQIDHSGTVATLPLTASGDRKSFQAMYSEKENMKVSSQSGNWNFVSRACIGTACGPRELQDSSKRIFSALGYISALRDTVTANGNIKKGLTGWASQKDWQKVGFPDCLDTTAGCKNANVPTNAKSDAPLTGGVNAWANYEWAVAADESHLICFKSGVAVPAVFASNSGNVCPAQCAACAKQRGVATTGNANTLRFSFEIYMNDRDGGDGMKDGNYAIFLSALDKVSAPLNNVTNKGNDDGWTRFTRSGAVCTGVNCPAGEDFVLVYDSTPPVVSVKVGKPNAKDRSVTTTAVITDPTSGVAGIANRYTGYRLTVGGVPEKDILWAEKSDGTDFDGSRDRLPVTPAASVSADAVATNIPAKALIVAGACAYDRAGNMRCSANPESYTFMSSWFKTSYGDIYNKGGFGVTLPSNSTTLTDATARIRDPFRQQIYTIATGMYLTSDGSVQGLSGGYTRGRVITPLGFLGNYRGESATSAFNILSYSPSMPGNEYDRLRAAGILNCGQLNEGKTILPCNNASTAAVSDLNSAEYSIITVTANTNWSASVISCSKVNIIFVANGTLTVGPVTSPVGGGCIFVVNEGATIEIVETSVQGRIADNPSVDLFEAAVVSDGGNVLFKKGTMTPRGADYLRINGFIYSSSTAPQFRRELAQVDILRYPAEHVLYDASILDQFRPLLGFVKTADLTCGTSTHVLCK